jgi:hypothetical protein
MCPLNNKATIYTRHNKASNKIDPLRRKNGPIIKKASTIMYKTPVIEIQNNKR